MTLHKVMDNKEWQQLLVFMLEHYHGEVLIQGMMKNDTAKFSVAVSTVLKN